MLRSTVKEEPYALERKNMREAGYWERRESGNDMPDGQLF